MTIDRILARMHAQEDELAKLRRQVELLKVQVNEEVCPFDCDNCHNDECPCDRLGCAGSATTGLG